MYLNAKKISFLGLLLAILVLLVILGSVIETNTLFLLGLASFCVGIAIRETSLKSGLVFYIASVLLSFFIAPNKFHCITFAALGLYIFIVEFSYYKLTFMKTIKNREIILWLIKYLVFNIMYIPALIFLPRLIFTGDINGGILAGLIIAGQIILFIYDMVYRYFQGCIWGKFRGKFNN